MFRSLFGSRTENRQIPALTQRLGFEMLDQRVLLSAANHVLVNEVVVNPPDKPDSPNEYIELRVTAGGSLTNMHVVALEGEVGGAGPNNPGNVDYEYDFTSTDQSNFVAKFGAGHEGLVIIAQPGNPYAFAGTNALVITDSSLTLENGSMSVLTFQANSTVSLPTDFDSDDDGVLDSVAGVTYVDAVGFQETFGGSDYVYGLDVTPSSSTDPDVMIRDNSNTHSFYTNEGTAGAWYAAELGNWDSTTDNWTIASFTFGSSSTITETTAGAANV